MYDSSNSNSFGFLSILSFSIYNSHFPHYVHEQNRHFVLKVMQVSAIDLLCITFRLHACIASYRCHIHCGLLSSCSNSDYNPHIEKHLGIFIVVKSKNIF